MRCVKKSAIEPYHVTRLLYDVIQVVYSLRDGDVKIQRYETIRGNAPTKGKKYKTNKVTMVYLACLRDYVTSDACARSCEAL